MKDFLSVVEFAAAAGVSKQAIYKRLSKDIAPYVTEQDGKKVISKEALKLFEKEPEPAAPAPKEQPNLLLDRIDEQAETIKEQKQEIEYLRSMLKSADERNNTLTAHLIESQNKQLELQKNYQLLLGAQNPILTAKTGGSQPVETGLTVEQQETEKQSTVEQPKAEKHGKTSIFSKLFGRG